MKKFYTKRQIAESIRFWENVLKRINESKSPLLDACVKQFGEDVVFGGKKLFELSDENVNALFKIIDGDMFGGKLKTVDNLDIYVGNESILDPIATRFNHNQPFSLKPYLALYFPYLNYFRHKITKKINIIKIADGMFLNIGGHAYAECAYVISSLCHEMIHCYDANFSHLIQWTEWMLNNGHTSDEINDGSHFTDTFEQKSGEMKDRNGISIRISGDDMNFEELNKKAFAEISALNENIDLSDYEPFIFTDEFKEKYKDIFSFNGPSSACMVFGQKMPPSA